MCIRDSSLGCLPNLPFRRGGRLIGKASSDTWSTGFALSRDAALVKRGSARGSAVDGDGPFAEVVFFVISGPLPKEKSLDILSGRAPSVCAVEPVIYLDAYWELLLREERRRRSVGVASSGSGGGVTGWLPFGVV